MAGVKGADLGICFQSSRVQKKYADSKEGLPDKNPRCAGSQLQVPPRRQTVRDLGKRGRFTRYARVHPSGELHAGNSTTRGWEERLDSSVSAAGWRRHRGGNPRLCKRSLYGNKEISFALPSWTLKFNPDSLKLGRGDTCKGGGEQAYVPRTRFRGGRRSVDGRKRRNPCIMPKDPTRLKTEKGQGAGTATLENRRAWRGGIKQSARASGARKKTLTRRGVDSKPGMRDGAKPLPGGGKIQRGWRKVPLAGKKEKKKKNEGNEEVLTSVVGQRGEEKKITQGREVPQSLKGTELDALGLPPKTSKMETTVLFRNGGNAGKKTGHPRRNPKGPAAGESRNGGGRYNGGHHTTPAQRDSTKKGNRHEKSNHHGDSQSPPFSGEKCTLTLQPAANETRPRTHSAKIQETTPEDASKTWA